MADEANNRFEIQHPEVWTLAVRLRGNGLQYALYSRMEDSSLSFGDISFDPADSFVKNLESAVYDHGFFLQQYGKMQFLSESPHFLLVPDEFSAGGIEAECERYFRFLYPEDKTVVHTDRIEAAGLSVVYGIEPETDAFLRRTFFHPPVAHVLTPLIRYFNKKDTFERKGIMYAYLAGDMVEVVAFKGRQVVLANYFRYRNTDDAFYYIMNAWVQCGMDAKKHELHVLGDKDDRRTLLPMLRQHVACVIQTIFPAQLLRLGKEAMSAPFDLIVLPLCE